MLLSDVRSHSSAIGFFYCSHSSDDSNAYIRGDGVASSCTKTDCPKVLVLDRLAEIQVLVLSPVQDDRHPSCPCRVHIYMCTFLPCASSPLSSPFVCRCLPVYVVGLSLVHDPCLLFTQQELNKRASTQSRRAL
jgi:hypothetical protein